MGVGVAPPTSALLHGFPAKYQGFRFHGGHGSTDCIRELERVSLTDNGLFRLQPNEVSSNPFFTVMIIFWSFSFPNNFIWFTETSIWFIETSIWFMSFYEPKTPTCLRGGSRAHACINVSRGNLSDMPSCSCMEQIWQWFKVSFTSIIERCSIRKHLLSVPAGITFHQTTISFCSRGQSIRSQSLHPDSQRRLFEVLPLLPPLQTEEPH